MPIGVNLSPGEWNSRLQKRSPLALANALIKILITRAGGFCLCSCGFNRQALIKLTQMGIAMPLQRVDVRKPYYCEELSFLAAGGAGGAAELYSLLGARGAGG